MIDKFRLRLSSDGVNLNIFIGMVEIPRLQAK